MPERVSARPLGRSGFGIRLSGRGLPLGEMMGGHRVVVKSVVSAGIGVDGGVRQAADVMEESVMGLLTYRVSLGDGEICVGDYLGLGSQFVPDPADPDRLDLFNAGHGCQDPFYVVDELRINRVHQSPVDVAGCVLQDEQDDHRDRQADHRIRQLPAQGHANGSPHHGERGQTVGARVHAVGHESG